MVLGLTGPNAAGKGEIASFLAGRGYRLHSLSDIIREEARRQGLPAEREHLIRIGNELRASGGPGVLAEMILPRLTGQEVVDSIRNPGEVEVLRRLPRFILIAVSAPERIRFERSVVRARPGDPRSLEEFQARERQENATDPRAQQLRRTFEMADHVVDNAEGIDALHRQIGELLTALEG